jgi:hypothetical protein
MVHVWIAQCLCPLRHCIIAAAIEAEGPAAAQENGIVPLRTTIDSLLNSRTLNPWCALCHASSSGWTYEVRRTQFSSLAEAEPTLRQVEADQIVTNALWGDMLRSD